MSISPVQSSPEMSGTSGRTADRSRRLRASAYEQVASALVSALMFVGVFVSLILVLYFSTRIFPKIEPVAVTMADVGGREEGTALGTARELEEPGSEEVPELMQEQPMEPLDVVTAASSRAAMIDDMMLETEFVAGSGKGKGDNRQVGSGKGGQAEMVPRAERWVIRFDGGDLKVYAKQLDSFGIEVAAVGGNENLVYYAYNLAKPKPDSRTGAPEAEQRLYMTWRSGPLQQADRALLAKAGVKLQGKVVMQFYPAETERLLATLELQYAGGKSVNEIRRTTFDLRVEGGKYVFVVASQQML